MINRRMLGIGMMVMTGDGLVRPVNAPQGQSTPVGVQPGTSGGIEYVRAVIIFGPAGSPLGLFLYPAGSAPGTTAPIASITNGSVDPYGYPTHPGITSQSSAGGSWVSLFSGQVLFQGGSEINGTAGGNIGVSTPGTFSVDGGPVNAVAGTAANPTLIITDTWQTATPLNGWTGTAQYQLRPDGTVALRTVGSLAAGTLTSGTNLFTVPAAYRTATAGQAIPAVVSAVGGGTTATGLDPYLLIGTDGSVEVFGISQQAATNIRFAGSYSLT